MGFQGARMVNKMSQLELDNLAMCIGSLAKLCAELRANGRSNEALNQMCRDMVQVLIKEQEKE